MAKGIDLLIAQNNSLSERLEFTEKTLASHTSLFSNVIQSLSKYLDESRNQRNSIVQPESQPLTDYIIQNQINAFKQLTNNSSLEPVHTDQSLNTTNGTSNFDSLSRSPSPGSCTDTSNSAKRDFTDNTINNVNGNLASPNCF